MVHALREAHRVLTANGILVDLRPAAVHRRVGIVRQGRFQHLGIMQERFDDDRAADRAIRQVLEEGLFKVEWRSQFDCRRVMDTLNDLRQWFEEFVASSDLPSHDWLVQRVERALSQKRAAWKIEVKGPLQVRVLRKLDNI
jgi:hypothetical protein